ncbi:MULTISPECIES: trypsin-like peptidase domain-containing protein [unclassified Bacteroides]|uniref:trypsin-like peptidase domain-containing protein n=1 Tax=unclassified Bacteroides TaxID=2646097 RepID=UPI000E8FE075|nr:MULTISPECIES: trypsin-like peptidase domain-containing protein [unclassified Bacteroides]RGN59246.1 serine protease [Bacteroides sp. OM05-10AA]RGQ65027.1 serine protease [Bacteroides sp. AF27-33]
MSLIDQICCISVEILCSDEADSSLGTGTIISDGVSYYVMTAGHCIKKNSNGAAFDISDIKVISYDNDVSHEINVLAIDNYNLTEEKDFAILHIANPDISFDFMNNVKRCDDIIDEEKYFFYGYTELSKTGRIYELQRRGKSQWHLKSDNMVNQPKDAITLMGGNSGAGVFFRKLDIFYYVGYVKQLLDEDGNLNDVIVYPSSRFDNYLSPVTKDENFFKLVKTWTDMENKEENEELRRIYQQENVEYTKNLERKMDVLFSHPKEASDKSIFYLDQYIRGLRLNNEINKMPYVAEKLREKDQQAFMEIQELRSKYFIADMDARKDLKEVKDKIMEAASNILYTDDKDKTLSKGYANYSIAEKLLICSLDYIKENS